MQVRQCIKCWESSMTSTHTMYPVLRINLHSVNCCGGWGNLYLYEGQKEDSIREKPPPHLHCVYVLLAYLHVSCIWLTGLSSVSCQERAVKSEYSSIMWLNDPATSAWQQLKWSTLDWKCVTFQRHHNGPKLRFDTHLSSSIICSCYTPASTSVLIVVMNANIHSILSMWWYVLHFRTDPGVTRCILIFQRVRQF